MSLAGLVDGLCINIEVAHLGTYFSSNYRPLPCDWAVSIVKSIVVGLKRLGLSGNIFNPLQ